MAYFSSYLLSFGAKIAKIREPAKYSLVNSNKLQVTNGVNAITSNALKYFKI